MTQETLPKILDLFEQGKSLTQDLLRENERLRLVFDGLRSERAELESRLQGSDTPGMLEQLQRLEQEITRLRQDNQSLKSRFSSVEVENREFAERYLVVEQQNSDLINMYVATYRLHSTLEYADVLHVIKEIVINMIGAEIFGVFVMNDDGRSLSLVAHEGMEPWIPDPRLGVNVPLGVGVVGKTAEVGTQHVAQDQRCAEPGGEPIACFPLAVSRQLVGAIAIYSLLAQKECFHSVDFELFNLLGGHAATALYGAKMYTLSERKRNTLEGFVNMIRQSGKTLRK